MTMSGFSVAGAFNTCVHGVIAKPILGAVLIPAVLAVFACGPTVYAKVFTKDCVGDKVAVAADGWANWVGKSGDLKFQVANNPLPKDLCVIEVTKEAAAAFAADQKLAWADFNRFKQQGS